MVNTSCEVKVNMNLNSGVNSFPEYENLKQRVDYLRALLTGLILERDALVLVECKNIETSYMLEVGQLEYEAYKLQSAVLRAQRKIEIIEDYIKDDKASELKAIDKKLNRESDMYDEQLEAQMNTIEAALERQERASVSEEKAQRMNEIYQMILEKLHPDLNPEISASELAFFSNARAAYEQADLNRLEVISRMVSEIEVVEKAEDGMAVLVREEQRLQELVEDVKLEIEKIKTEYPYSMKHFVQDKTAVEEKKADLRAAMSQFEDAHIRYKAIIRDRLEKIEE